jgi:hypothetical protein
MTSAKRHLWTPDQIKILESAYPDTPTKALAATLGCPVAAIYHKAEQLGLKKSAAYLASPHACRLRQGDGVGNATQFQPGLVPWNKGTNFTAGGRSAETRFKPGRKPSEARNYKPIGSLRMTRAGHLEQKISDDQSIYPKKRWTAVHRLVWEAAHGPIPAGKIVVFKPGQHTTELEQITPDRLELITRQENMARNTVHRLPKELARLVQLQGALNRQINKRTKA